MDQKRKLILFWKNGKIEKIEFFSKFSENCKKEKGFVINIVELKKPQVTLTFMLLNLQNSFCKPQALCGLLKRAAWLHGEELPQNFSLFYVNLPLYFRDLVIASFVFWG